MTLTSQPLPFPPTGKLHACHDSHPFLSVTQATGCPGQPEVKMGYGLSPRAARYEASGSPDVFSHVNFTNSNFDISKNMSPPSFGGRTLKSLLHC